LKWLKSSQKKLIPLKVMAGDNFMAVVTNVEKIQTSGPDTGFDFNSLKTANKKSSENLDDKKKKAEELVDKAMTYLDKFHSSDNLDYISLEKAAKYLLEAAELTPRDAEIYVCLAYILYKLNKENEAIKCLDLAQAIDPDSESIKKIISYI
jgi:tetratricopeptide (TPR) repeat protein